MDTIPANLRTLVEQLDDSRQFHDAAAQQSSGALGERHRDKARAYAAMLSEIGEWESRNSDGGEPKHSAASSVDPDCTNPGDGYAALLDRVYRIHRAIATHSAVAPIAEIIRIRATGNAMDGEARDGRRRAGERVRC
ncbi:MAG: hypothetical protein ACREPU_04350 [Rhodanobacteraceae bacterium]